MTSVRSGSRAISGPIGTKVSGCPASSHEMKVNKVPIDDTSPPPPSISARLTCVSILVAVFSIWGKLTFVDKAEIPSFKNEIHSYLVPLVMTTLYLVSLPTLKFFTDTYLADVVDVKLLLRESMVLYNAAQVIINGWIVYEIVTSIWSGEHPVVGADSNVHTAASYAIWVHYTDKYLEFFDTYFMVLRGKMDQVSFLHVYHHTSIAWAWWAGLRLCPGGDVYFGALLNSLIHVMMYSYYTLSLLRISCPWKKYLTQAQLLQFLSVLAYSAVSFYRIPEDFGWQQKSGYVIQVFEMTSMFVLFTLFYIKAYNKKRDDQQKVVEAAACAIKVAESDTASDTVAEHASVSSESSEEDRDEKS